MKFINKIQKFMYGRYGLDSLNKFLFEIYIILVIINLFLRTTIITCIEFLIIIITLYRFLSKKIYNRSNENQIFVKIKSTIIKPFTDIKRNFKERKNKIYKKCSKCKTILRLPLPSKRGIKHAVCPTCKKRLTIISFRKEHIEIIDKKGRKKA